MGQRRQVAGRADRTLDRDDGQGVGVEQRQQPLDHGAADPAHAAAESDRL
jgi:hypothetical protein